MSVDRTLAIIKPDAFGSGHAGDILARLEDEGFRVVAAGSRPRRRGPSTPFTAGNLSTSRL
jgi:predicted mannosyl-3-phosphoglycerate phosphatase (HAD superfamily)